MPLPPLEQLAARANSAAAGDADERPPRSIWPVRRGGDDPLTFLAGLAESDAAVVPFALGRRPAVLLNDPAAVEDVLVRRAALFPKGRGYQHAARLLGSGLLTASGAVHRHRRRLAQGAFDRRRIAALAPAIVRHADRQALSWTEGVPIDVAREMRALTLAVAGETLFGADLDPWADEVHEAVSFALSPLDGMLAIVAPPARARKARQRLEAVVRAIVDARSRAVGGAASVGTEISDAGERGDGRPDDDLLSMLLDARDAEQTVSDPRAADEQLHDDVLTFLLASHDTLSHALTWTWLLLSAHVDADERLGREISAVLGERAAQADDLPHLPYTRAVVAEALRLFPPAWVIVRRAAQACRIGSVEVPAGAVLIASPFTTHRRARFFEQPLQFLPERWLAPADPDAPAPPKLSYFPFGAGPRACIGERFAWFEATLVLATLARSWRLARTTNAPVETIARITLRPKDEPPMIPLRRRVG